MKKTKIIIPALAMLAMSTAATVTGTVAWFSMNKTVKAEGMLLSAKGSGSVIITKYDPTDTLGYGLPKDSDRTTGVDFGSTAHAFFPSTHINTATKSYVTGTDVFSGAEAPAKSYVTGLKYVTNGADINRETGTGVQTSTVLTYDVASGNDYFFDYDIFIAGDRQTFSNQKLGIAINYSTPNNAALENVMRALSIDFYGAAAAGQETDHRAQVNNDNYIGTLNVAGTKNTSNKTKVSDHASIEVSGITIPAAVSATSAGTKYGTVGYAVKMRAYYDGALIDSAGATPNTSLVQCATGDLASKTTRGDYSDYTYFYNQQGYIMESVDKDGGTSQDVIPNTYYVIDKTNSTTTYARTADILKVQNIGISVTFTMSEATNNG